MKAKILLMCWVSSLLFISCNKGEKKPDTGGTGELKLEYMEVKEPSTASESAELFLHGQFGDWNSSSSVRIGTNIFTGAPDASNPHATIKAWSRGLIWIRIPKADDPGGSGLVKITSGGKESNTRTLNVWEGVLTYKYPSGDALLEKCDINFILRGDSKPYVNVPGASLLRPESSFARNSYVNWVVKGSASSQYDGCTMSVRWTEKSGTIPWYGSAADNATLSENFQSTVQYLVSLQTFVVKSLKIHKFNTTKSDITFTCGQDAQQQDVHLTNMPGVLAEMIALELDPNTSAIKAGSKTLEQQSNHAGLIYDAGTVPNLIAEVKWDDIPAKYPNQ